MAFPEGSAREMRGMATPSTNPASGNLYQYAKTDGSLYIKDSNGAEEVIPGLRIVRVATLAAITLSGTQTIDGVAVVAGDRVLVRTQGGVNQTGNAKDNGIWVVAAGAWTRATDANTSAKIAGVSVLVTEGTRLAGMTFTTTFKSTDTLGTTAMAFWATNRVETGSITEQPKNAAVGQAFFNDADRYLGFWNGSQYVLPKGIQDYSSAAPPFPAIGEIWIDTSVAPASDPSLDGDFTDLYAGNYSVGSTIFGAVGNTLSFTSPGTWAVYVVSYTVVGQPTSNIVNFVQLAVDGVKWGGTSARTHTPANTSYFTVSRTYRVTGLAAGAHTFGIVSANNAAGTTTHFGSDSTLMYQRVI